MRLGEVTLSTPRDRDGTFEPVIVGKHQRRIPDFDEKIVALYAKGMTTRDIQEIVKDLYGVEVSATLISEITADLDAEVTAWRNRTLDSVWPIVYFDGLVVHVRGENRRARAAHDRRRPGRESRRKEGAVGALAPGNAAHSTGYGCVDYDFVIGKFHVTNSQYVAFLNGVDPVGGNTLALYNSAMTGNANGGIDFNGAAANGSKYKIKPGRDNNPVVYVSWYDSIRFANWLHNGQGNGDTETGAYTLGPLGTSGVPINGDSITRNPGARWWLTSENEWHKAAYHKNDGIIL